MDPHLKYSDSDNRYSNPFGHTSSTLNKSPNPASYTSAHNIDSSTHHHTQPSHISDSKVIISSSLGSPYMDYSQGVHRTTNSQSSAVGAPKDSNLYVSSHEHGSRRYGSGLGSSSSNVDLGGSNRKSSSRRISDEALDTMKSKTFGLGTKTSGHSDVATNYKITPTPETLPAGGQFLSSLPNVRSYGVGSNLKEMIYGADNKHEQRQRLLSPEAERILHGHAVDTYQSNLHGSRHALPQESTYQSVLAEGSHLKKSYTPVDTTKTRGRQTATRVSHDMGSPPLTRDALEANKGDQEVREYQIAEPHVSKKTIYTIENSNTNSNKQIATSEGRSHRTPEKSPRAIMSSHSPLDNLRHSLKNEGARISRIVIETIDNGDEDVYYDIDNASGKKQVRQSNPRFEHFERSPYDEPRFQSHLHTPAEQPVVREHKHHIHYDEPKTQGHTSHTHIVPEPVIYREHKHHTHYDEPKHQSHIHTVTEQPIVREYKSQTPSEPKSQSHTSHTHIVPEPVIYSEHKHQSHYDEPKYQSHIHTATEQPIYREHKAQIKSPYQSPPMSSRQHSSRDLDMKNNKKPYDLKKELEELRHEIVDYTRTSQQLENLPELRYREKGRYEPHSGSAYEYESEQQYQDYEPEHEHEHEHHREHEHIHHHHHHEHEHEHEHAHHQEPSHKEHEKHVHEPKVEHVEHVHKKKIESPIKETPAVCKEKKSRHLIVKGVIGLLVIILCSILWMELCTDINLDEYSPPLYI